MKIRTSIMMGYKKTEMLRWRRDERREKKRDASLQSQEPRNFVRETKWANINYEELNQYTSRLRDGL